jgi:hypothetical protein
MPKGEGFVTVTPAAHSRDDSGGSADTAAGRVAHLSPVRQAALGRLLAAKAATSGGRPIPRRTRDGGPRVLLA